MTEVFGPHFWDVFGPNRGYSGSIVLPGFLGIVIIMFSAQLGGVVVRELMMGVLRSRGLVKIAPRAYIRVTRGWKLEIGKRSLALSAQNVRLVVTGIPCDSMTRAESVVTDFIRSEGLAVRSDSRMMRLRQPLATITGRLQQVSSAVGGGREGEVGGFVLVWTDRDTRKRRKKKGISASSGPKYRSYPQGEPSWLSRAITKRLKESEKSRDDTPWSGWFGLVFYASAPVGEYETYAPYVHRLIDSFDRG